MKKTFSNTILEIKSLFKNRIFKNKKLIFKSIGLLFIPFIYAFTSIFAFYDPIGNINRLPIIVVNSDNNSNKIINSNSLFLDDNKKDKYDAYNFSIDNITFGNETKNFDGYYYDVSNDYLKNENKFKEYLFKVNIDENFSTDLNNMVTKIIGIVKNDIGKPLSTIWSDINSKVKDKPILHFEYSYKINPIIGTINTMLFSIENKFNDLFFGNLVDNIILQYWKNNKESTGSYDSIRNNIKILYFALSQMIPGFGVHLNNINENISKINNDQELKNFYDDENQYWLKHSVISPTSFVTNDVNGIGADKPEEGYGIGPYFICIGSWIASMLLTFLFLSKKENKEISFLSNYLAKAFLVSTYAFIQSIILSISLLILFNNHTMWIHSWEFILFVSFTSIMFALICQAISFMFKDPDATRFIIIILLVLQLTSSSGTFLVTLEPTFFQFIHHIIPFTYAIQALFSIVYLPNTYDILINTLYLLIITVTFISMSFSINGIKYAIKHRKLKK